MPIRILIVDDHGVMRAGLRALLQDDPSIEVIGEAASGEEMIQLVSQVSPEVVLLDIGLPGIGGIEATRLLKRIHPEIHVVVLTVHEEESLLREALKAGASGYVIKRAAEEELIAAIKSVWRGDMYIHPAMTRLLVKDLSSATPHRKEALESLTPRELEVMEYLVRGYTNRQIAEALTLSVRTVEGHRASIYGKLGVKNRLELVEFVRNYRNLQ
jgi:DNA-binding NarL/FixJ family response regulator